MSESRQKQLDEAAEAVRTGYRDLHTFLYLDKSLFPPRVEELVDGRMDWVSPETEQAFLRWVRAAKRYEWLLAADGPGGLLDPPQDAVLFSAAKCLHSAAGDCLTGLELVSDWESDSGLFVFYMDIRAAAAMTALSVGGW